MRKIPVLMITSRPEDEAELKELLHNSPGELETLPRIEDPAAALRAAAVPLVLFDGSTADTQWREEMKALIQSRRNACVILLTNVSDQYLWEEVVQQGGFDLLTRPFRKEQVFSTLLFAYTHFRTPWPKTIARSG
jgi:AmiR/NasT family two-component response regulator